MEAARIEIKGTRKVTLQDQSIFDFIQANYVLFMSDQFVILIT